MKMKIQGKESIEKILLFLSYVASGIWFAEISHSWILGIIGALGFLVFWYVLGKEKFTSFPLLLLLLSPLARLISLPSKFAHLTYLPLALLGIGACSWFFALTLRKKKLPTLSWKHYTYALILLFFISVSLLGVLKHLSFHSTASDLAIYDQAVWKFSRGDIGMNTIIQFPQLGDHLEPILFLIVPFYWIAPSPLTLIILQCFLLSSGAIALWLLGRKIVKHDGVSFALVCAYLFHPSLHFMALFDFHPVTLSLPFFLWAWYFLEERKYGVMSLFLVLAGMTQEHIPSQFFLIGVYIWWKHKQRLLGVAISTVSLVWTWVNFKILLPYFAGGSYPYLLGQSLFSIVVKKLMHPGMLVTQYAPFFALVMLPLSIFPVFSLTSILAIPEALIITFFMNIGITEIALHHQASMLAFLFIASVYGIQTIRKLTAPSFVTIATILLIISSVFSFVAYSPYTIVYDKQSFNIFTEHVQKGNEVLKQIPSEASVMSTNWILPHLSQRREVYQMNHYTTNTTFFGPATLFDRGSPQFAILDLSPSLIDGRTNGFMITLEDVNNMLTDEKYGIKEIRGDWILLEKGLSPNRCVLSKFKGRDYLNLTVISEADSCV